MTSRRLLLAVSLACLAQITCGKVLVVGATGGTGLRAIRGLMDTGLKPADLAIFTRDASKQRTQDLGQAGFGIVQADLDSSSSLLAEAIPRDCTGCYIHSTSSDTKVLDTAEVSRAVSLAKAIVDVKNIRSVVYNSSAAERTHKVYRIQQKHDAEEAYIKQFMPAGIRFTALRANLFMEELWKDVSGRPKVLEGKFRFALTPNRKLYLTSVRDMGRLAGRILLQDEQEGDGTPQEPPVRRINVAGDHLTCVEMANAFAAAQDSPCQHSNARLLKLLTRLFFRDLFQHIRHYQTSTEETSIVSLEKQFPGDLTSFPEFLDETQWGDSSRSFQDFGNVAEMLDEASY